MILDTSALIRLLMREDGWEPIRDILASASPTRICAGTLAELLIVAEHRFETTLRPEAEALIAWAGTEVVPMTDQDAELAANAYARYGKGKHPARLNICDCFAYALAKRTGEPLLCTGKDFAQTDLELVPLP